MFWQLIPIVVPVFLCVGIGFFWARLDVPFDREFITRIVMNVGAPCLILDGIGRLAFESARRIGLGHQRVFAHAPHPIVCIHNPIVTTLPLEPEIGRIVDPVRAFFTCDHDQCLAGMIELMNTMVIEEASRQRDRLANTGGIGDR